MSLKMDIQDQSRGSMRAIIVWGMGDIYFIVSVMIAVLFGIFSPNLQQQLHLDSAQIGLLGSVFFLSYGVAQFVAGGLIDSWGPRFTLAGSSVIAMCGLFLLSVAGGLKMAIVAQLLIGVGLSTSYLGAIYLAGTWFSPDRFSLVSGITQMSANIMTAALVQIMALSGALVSFRIITKYLGLITLVVAILMLIIIRSAPVQATQFAEGSQKGKFTTNLHRLVMIPQFWFATIYFSTSFGVLIAFSNLWNIPNQLAYGHSLQTAAIINSMLPLGGAFGALLAGWSADYLKCRSTVAKFFIGGMLLLGAVLVYGPAFPSVIAFLLLLLLGFFFGGAVLGFPLVGQYVQTELKGTAFGFMAMIAYLLSALLQYLVGALLGEVSTPGTPAAISDFKLALTPLIVTLMIGFICSWWLNDPNSSSGLEEKQ